MTKILSVTLALVLSLSVIGAGVGVCANETANEPTQAQLEAQEKKAALELEKAIIEVKKRIGGVPAKFDIFSYDISTSYYVPTYTFKWTYAKLKDEHKDKYDDKQLREVDSYTLRGHCSEFQMIEVAFSEDIITNYSYADKNYKLTSKHRFAKLSEDKQLEFAKNHVKKLNPKLVGNLTVERLKKPTLADNESHFSIKCSFDGLDVPMNTGSVTIDRDTGRLLSMKLEWWNKVDFPRVSNSISVSQAQSIYKGTTGELELSYEELYNYEKEEYEIRLVYNPENEGMTEMDAITGKPTSFYDDRIATYSYEWRNYGKSTSYLDESLDDVFEEYYERPSKNVIGEKSALLSKEQALDIIKKDKFVVFNEELAEASASMRHFIKDNANGYSESIPYWSLAYKYSSDTFDDAAIDLDIHVNAVSGEIIYFWKLYTYYSSSLDKPTAPITRARAESIANNAIKHFAGDIAGKYKITRFDSGGSSSFSSTVIYTRFENNIPYYGNWVRIDVSPTGELLSFETNHDYLAKFPSPTAISQENAYKILFKNMKPDFVYDGFLDPQGKPHTYLIYKFPKTFKLDAKTGDHLTDMGKVWVDEKEPRIEEKHKGYTDIKGHKNEKAITNLAEYGIIITDESQFKPDDSISIYEFARLMQGIYGGSTGLYWNNIVRTVELQNSPDWDPKEPKINYDLPMTKAEFAKTAVGIYHSGSVDMTQIPGIFYAPFDDVPTSNEYCGYIATANYYGYVSGVGNKFYPNKTITKGEAMQIVYDYLFEEEEKEFYSLFRAVTDFRGLRKVSN